MALDNANSVQLQLTENEPLGMHGACALANVSWLPNETTLQSEVPCFTIASNMLCLLQRIFDILPVYLETLNEKSAMLETMNEDDKEEYERTLKCLKRWSKLLCDPYYAKLGFTQRNAPYVTDKNEPMETPYGLIKFTPTCNLDNSTVHKHFHLCRKFLWVSVMMTGKGFTEFGTATKVMWTLETILETIHSDIPEEIVNSWDYQEEY